MAPQPVIGLTGPNAAGKGEVAAHLVTRGFAAHSLSDIVREAAAERGLPPERGHLIRIGNELRREGGAAALARQLLPRLKGPTVVDSIRNPAEARLLRQELPGFVLVGVTASTAKRFERSRRRDRAGDAASLEEFEARERQENSSDPRAQQLAATLALADHTIDNSGGLNELHEQVDRLLRQLGIRSQA